MPAWVSSTVRPAPRDRRVLVRFGGTFFDAGYSLWRQKWFHLIPGGGEREIADPPLWWDKDAPDLSAEDQRALLFGQEVTSAKPLRGPQQASFCFDGGDSGKLSPGHSR